MHSEINMQFELKIYEDKTVPLAALAEFVTQQDIESVLLEGIVESLDTVRIETLCGQKHARGNGNQRYLRAGTDTRTTITTAGEHEFTLHHVRYIAADHDEVSYFRPVQVESVLDGQNRYHQDIAAKSADLATSLRYREAADHGDGFVLMPSPTTISH